MSNLISNQKRKQAIVLAALFLGSLSLGELAKSAPQNNGSDHSSASAQQNSHLPRTSTLRPGQSAVERFLVEGLKVEEPERFLLTDKLRNALERGHQNTDEPAFTSDGTITEAGKKSLLSKFSKQSVETIEKVILSFGLSEYPNAMLIGPAGGGKSFALNQIISVLSFGVVPEHLRESFGLSGNKSPFLDKFREDFFNKTQFVSIDHDLLSRDNTRSGQAYAKSEVRMRALLIDIINAAKEDFRVNKKRTIFVLEEVATFPELVQQTLKTVLDETGYAANSDDPMLLGKEVGFSFIGITTPEEYREMVGSDSAVERRYVYVALLEPSEQQALHILLNKVSGWEARYGLTIDEATLSYIISMRKFFSHPPLAMPHSVIKITDGLLQWCTNSKNRKHDNEVTIEEAYEYLVRQAHLAKESWLPANGKAPLYDLAERVKKRVIGHEKEIDQIARIIKAGRVTGFRDAPFFIIMGPSGSGKDTILRAFNEELFGHDGRHLHFDIAGANGSLLKAIIEGSPGDEELPLLARAMNDGTPNGIIGLNEGKDLPSNEFSKLKVFVEDAAIHPRGKDTRSRPLGLNAIFLMGQWGEELFEGKTEAQIDDIMNKLTDDDLIKILKDGKAGGMQGALPPALIQRALRTGGLIMLRPNKQSNFVEIAKLNLKAILENLKMRSQIHLTVDDSIIQYVSKVAAENELGPRVIDGLLKDLTETAISEAIDQGLPLRNVNVMSKIDLHSKAIVIEEIKNDKPAAEYRIPLSNLVRYKCELLFTK